MEFDWLDTNEARQLMQLRCSGVENVPEVAQSSKETLSVAFLFLNRTTEPLSIVERSFKAFLVQMQARTLLHPRLVYLRRARVQTGHDGLHGRIQAKGGESVEKMRCRSAV